MAGAPWADPHDTARGRVLARAMPYALFFASGAASLVYEVLWMRSRGGSAGRQLEGVQADLPLALAGRPRSVYFLGVATSITAGAALRPPVEQVSPEQMEWVRAGEALHRAFIRQHVGGAAETAPLEERFRAAVPYDVYAAFRERIELLR